MQKVYEIAGQKYIQRAIVLGQFRALMDVLSDLHIDGTMDPIKIAFDLGRRLPNALAVVMIEDGASIRDAMQPDKLAHRSESLSWAIEPELAVEVITDFFAVNPVSSLGEKIGGHFRTVRESLNVAEADLSPPSINFPEATSPGETASSGESRRELHSSGSDSGPSKSVMS